MRTAYAARVFCASFLYPFVLYNLFAENIVEATDLFQVELRAE